LTLQSSSVITATLRQIHRLEKFRFVGLSREVGVPMSRKFLWRKRARVAASSCIDFVRTNFQLITRPHFQSHNTLHNSELHNKRHSRSKQAQAWRSRHVECVTAFWGRGRSNRVNGELQYALE